MTKKTLLAVIFIVLVVATVFATPRPGYGTHRPGMTVYDHFLGSTRYDYITRIAEEDIPMPEFQYELPEALVGQFVMVSSYVDHIITIYPNNKYIILYDLVGHIPHETYGHIINIENKWYFSPVQDQRHFLFYGRPIEINLTDTGFSYYHDDFGLYTSMRKENMPKPEFLAEDISLSREATTRQYYSSEAGIIDFNEIENHPHGFILYSLWVDNGIVEIVRLFHYFNGNSYGSMMSIFGGFIEKTNETADSIKGTIKFTNGIPYFFTDGTAEIELNSDGRIIITMLYTPQLFYRSRHEELHFPLPLVLEF